MAEGIEECPHSALRGPAMDLFNAWARWTLSGVLPYGVDEMGDMPQPIVHAFSLCNMVQHAAAEKASASFQVAMTQLLSRARNAASAGVSDGGS